MAIYGSYTASGSITRARDNACIPPDPANRDYREAMEAVTAGDTITPYVAPVPKPLDFQLTRRQIRLALIYGGLTTDPDGWVGQALAAIPDATQRAIALIDWQEAPFYLRTHPLFNDPAILTAKGITPTMIDKLWMLGTTLPA